MKPQRGYPDPVPNAGFETIATHFGDDYAAREGAAAPPIFQTSTFVYPDAEAFAGRRKPDSPHHDYTRVSNPTTEILEAKIARLERGRWCHMFGSGMGAITAAINSVVSTGSHVVSVANVYGPTRTYLRQMKRFGVETTFVDGVAYDSFVGAFRDNTKLLYLESPTSGYFECPEIAPLAVAARDRGIVTIFDNSWASPYFMNPLDYGIDLVVHSVTKYLNGHSDVVAGTVIGRDAALRDKVLNEAELLGATLDPFAAWLIMRGLRTLAVRMQHHQKAGLAAATMLESHPKVARVIHPGLPSHPQHAIAARQCRGFAGLFSVVLREQTREATFRFLDRLKLFGQGVSWGGHESLAIGGTFFNTDPTKTEWLIRLHVGLESVDDILADLRQALE
ncbi:MAG: aminotransferase class I/II-fold pyridoxal phosphate-dependent enzyme [Phycisphaerales bacterium]|nr:aminotransferase class I/II-fold pyridoxal phosphate-dependent enzyme [Phycisphaerales bacterium]